MSGMFGGGDDIHNEEKRANGVVFQSSVKGTPIPIAFGRARLSGNLIWYNHFKAIPHTTSQTSGGKGGGATITNTTYTYTASFMFGLCEGPIDSIVGIWKGKDYQADPSSLKEVYTPKVAYNEERYISGSHQTRVAHGENFLGHIRADVITTDSEGGTSSETVTPTNVSSDGLYTFNTLSDQYVRITYQYNGINISPAIIDQADGGYTQDRWAEMLAHYEDEGLWYRGIAYAAAWDWNLGASTGMPNLNFEVIGMNPFTVRGIVLGANPADIVMRLLTDAHFGLGFPSTYLGDWAKYRDYCLAAGMFLSPSYTAQEEASSILGKLMRLTNSGLLFSEGVLKIIPFGDTALSKTVAADGYNASYTPNIQPIYELNDDDFIVDGAEDPVIIDRRPVADSYNHVQVEYLDSDNQFNAEIAEAKDPVAIEYYGLRTMDPLQAHEITLAGTAKAIAQNILQRSLYVRNSYTFKLGWKYCLLEPGDFVTITDPASGLNHTPVRIVSIEEDDTGLLTIEAEDAPPGVSHSETYPHQEARGFTLDYNTPSGAANPPVIFEAPWPFTANGHEIRIAASVGVNSGGCHVWFSNDGDSFVRVGVITAPACHGFLTEQMAKFADGSTTGTCSVDLSESGGILTSGGAEDANNKTTLAWVDGEFISFTTAELQANPFQYKLKGLMRRGLYATKATTHAERSPFTLCDDRLFRYAYDPDLAGKTIYVKLQAFNQFGAGTQDLANAVAYPCTLVGYLPTPTNLYRSVAPEGSIVFGCGSFGTMSFQATSRFGGGS
ncbi:MAG: hypothetical protein HQL57_11080 [Magnetococcales bacterium]|nr:hypothetical protein [Magnetococcales bacterium]